MKRTVTESEVNIKKAMATEESIFYVCYLLLALAIGLYLMCTAHTGMPKLWAGLAVLCMFVAEGFRLLPRIFMLLTGNTRRYAYAVERSKQLTAILLTLFYILLYHIECTLCGIDGIGAITVCVYLLACLRLAFCFFPKDQWVVKRKGQEWSLVRSLPLVCMGVLIALMCFIYPEALAALTWLWLALLFILVCYLPIAFQSDKGTWQEYLTIPSMCCYVWIFIMFLSL